MTPAQLRRAAKNQEVTARIISDGCRDYFVEIERPSGAGVLRRRWKGPMRFKSLSEVHHLLNQCRVKDVLLVSRVADDEAGCPPGIQSPSHPMPIGHRVH